MDIHTLYEEFLALDKKIELLLEESGYMSAEGMLDISMDRHNPNEGLLYEEFASMLSHLAYIHSVLGYLQKPVIQEGVIRINKRGNYEINGMELKHQEPFEILVHDEYADMYRWYLTEKSEADLNGKRARIRG